MSEQRLPDKNWRVLFRWRWGGVGVLTLAESRGDAIGRTYDLLKQWMRDEVLGLDELWLEYVASFDRDGYPRFAIDSALPVRRVRDKRVRRG